MNRAFLSLQRKKVVFLAGLLFSVALFSLSLGMAARSSAATCDKVNIVYCGMTGSDASSYISSVKQLYAANNDNGHTDIQQMFGWGGFSQAVINSMDTTNTKVGTLTRDGVIVVDGQTVATGTNISARFTSGAGFTQIKSGVWSRPSSVSMADASDPVLIVFDANGKAIAGIVIHCGNTLQFVATPPPVSYGCTALTPTMVSRLDWSFHTDAYAKNATITNYTYDFGDGSAKQTTGDTVAHKYSKGGTYNIVVVVNVSGNGHAYSSTCKKSITVATPTPSCVELAGSNKDLAYTFVATGSTTEGATLVSGNFDFGDGTTATNQKASGNTVTVAHTYDNAGNYSAGASLTFTVDGAPVTAATCRATVSPNKPPVPECKPGIPVGDIRCNPCTYDASFPADDVRCVPPATSLPNTGAGNVIAIGSVALIGGFLWYRHLLFTRHKRAYMAADLGVSPLPLGEPLESNAPLAGTPLANQPSAKHLFRRRRQF